MAEAEETTETTASSETAAEAPWYSSFADETLRAKAETKGWTSPEEAVRSYDHLERWSKGSPNVVAIPEGDDGDAWAAFYDKLGRPETPDAYTFEPPEGAAIDNGTLDRLRKDAHAAGLTKAQWDRLSKAYAESQMEAAQRAQVDLEATRNQEVEEWRKASFKSDSEFDLAVARGKLAVQTLGLDQDTLGQLEAAVGSKPVLDLMTRIGAKLGDDKLLDGAGSTMGPRSQAQARVEMQQMYGDKDTAKSLVDPTHPQHKVNNERLQELQRIAFSPSRR